MLLPRYDQENGETMNHFIVSETLLSYIMTNNTLMEKYFVFVHQLGNTPLGIACKKFYSIIYCIWKKKRFSKIIIHIFIILNLVKRNFPNIVRFCRNKYDYCKYKKKKKIYFTTGNSIWSNNYFIFSRETKLEKQYNIISKKESNKNLRKSYFY